MLADNFPIKNIFKDNIEAKTMTLSFVLSRVHQLASDPPKPDCANLELKLNLLYSGPHAM